MTTAVDASGNNNTATLLNGPGWAAGHSGSAVSFDGINDYVSAGNITALNGLTAVTVSAWVKGSVGAGSADGVIVVKDAAFALVAGVLPHKAAFGVKSGNTWYGFPSSTTNVDDGNFHFLTGVYDGTTLRIYVDGAQQGSQNVGLHTLNAPSTPVQIASCVGGPNCDGSGEMWKGLVDDVRIYNRALSQTEIQTDRDTPVSAADSIPPSAPTNVVGTAISSSQINLTWTASTDNVGVASYQVFRNGSMVGTSATPSFADTGGTPSTTYTYTVAAKDAALNTSALSSPISVTTQADTTPPSVPTNVVGTAISSTQINLTWTASTDNVGVTGYQVFRNGSVIGTPSAASFSDSGLSPSTTYTYTVGAVDAALNTSAPSSPILVTTPAAGDTTPPSVPTNVVGTAVSSTQVNLTWTASTDNVGVTEYQVFRNNSLIGTSVTPSFADGGLTPSTTCAYTVAAMDAALNTSALSLPIFVTTLASSDTTPPTVPANVVGTAISSTQINLTWTASTDNVGVSAYQVFRNGSLIGTSATPSFADSGLTPSTTYTYTIAAMDAALNTSTLSAAVAVTTQAAGGPPSSVLASDSFDRANGGLGANWTVIDSNPRIVSQHVEETNASDGNDSIAIYTALTWPANQYTQVTVRAASLHSGCSAIVRVKNDPVIEMYFVYVTGPLGPGARLTLAKFVKHVYTELWSSVLPVNSGDVLYLSANGTTLTVMLNGTTLTTQVDGSITAAGYSGFDVTDYDGMGAPGDGQCDSWEGGTVGSLTAPTNVTGTAVSSSQVNLSWTASTGTGAVTGYKILRNGALVGTTPSTSYSDIGLALGTSYTYAVMAYDADGNTSPLSTSIAVTTLGDTTPPSVPTNLAGTAISSSQITLTWTASTDNVGVVSYRVFRNGSQIGTSGTPSFTDSGLLPSTTYSYAVTAVDFAGNGSALSVPVNVTTNNVASPSVPVVAFAFDEAGGSIANDFSGNNNQGTLINGPTWAGGHSGSAVSFDGINDYVSAGNIPTLNGLTAVTASAWVNGSVGMGSPDAIIVAKDAAFALVVSSHKAQFGVKSGNTWYGFPSSTTSVDDGNFHFVTGVYDGAAVRVYVDGVLQGSQNIGALTLNAPSTALEIASCTGGPNCAGSGEMWHGLIDDVRVYNRALSASEIMADMNSAVH